MIRNEAGQLGLGDTKDRFCPVLIEAITGYHIVKVTTFNSTFLLKKTSPYYLFFSNLYVGWEIIKYSPMYR